MIGGPIAARNAVGGVIAQSARRASTPPLIIPSDFDVLWWVDAPNTLYADVDMLVPATDGSVIRTWKDASGTKHLAQAGDVTVCPTLRVGMVNGRNFVDFDGGDWVSGFHSCPTHNRADWSYYAVIYRDAALNTQYIYDEYGGPNNYSRFIFPRIYGTQPCTWQVRSSATGQTGWVGSGLSVGTGVWLCSIQKTGTDLVGRVNGVDVMSVSTAGTPDHAAEADIYLGRSPSAGAYANTNIALEGFIFGADSHAHEAGIAEYYGITLP